MKLVKKGFLHINYFSRIKVLQDITPSITLNVTPDYSVQKLDEGSLNRASETAATLCSVISTKSDNSSEETRSAEGTDMEVDNLETIFIPSSDTGTETASETGDILLETDTQEIVHSSGTETASETIGISGRLASGVLKRRLFFFC